jgi:hypothetical protein
MEWRKKKTNKREVRGRRSLATPTFGGYLILDQTLARVK